MGALHRIADRLPDKLSTWLRDQLVPDEQRLVFRLLEDRATARVMVDVGACTGSSLRSFAGSGWSVYAFEPDPENRSALRASWGEHPAVHIDARAVSNREESEVPFFRSDLSPGISGLSAFSESHRSAGSVEVTTLDVVFREENISAVDFVKIDTEGFDLFVLKGLPWRATRPRVVVCEFEDSKTVPLGYGFDDLATYLVDLEYRVMVSEWYPVVVYGGQHRWRRFVPYPCTLADTSAWGNLIAMRDQDDFDRLLAASRSLSFGWRIGSVLKRILPV